MYKKKEEDYSLITNKRIDTQGDNLKHWFFFTA